MTSPQITDVQRLYGEAEAAIKLYERIGLDNLVSAINELRYAGDQLEKINADRQFLLSFTISAGGTIVGFLGTMLAIYGTIQEYRLVGMLVGCLGLFAVIFVLYRWARRNLLIK